MTRLNEVLNTERYALSDPTFRSSCRDVLARDGALLLPNFLTASALSSIQREGEDKRQLAFFCTQRHNVYLTQPSSSYPADHPRNRQVDSSKGCITDDQISTDSALRTLYDAGEFRNFLCVVLEERALYPYADSLSSINLHYADAGQELGWHFDNSSFAITLLIQKPESGGEFEYVRQLRDSERGEMNYDGVGRVLSDASPGQILKMDAGALVLFRGRDAMHRVTPVMGTRTRLLVVLAYNTEPNIELSESARMTFYGRLN